MTQSELWLAKWQEAVDFLETYRRKPSKFIPEERNLRSWWKHNKTTSFLKLALYFCLFAPLAKVLCCRHSVFVKEFGRKSNLVIPIDGPTIHRPY